MPLQHLSGEAGGEGAGTATLNTDEHAPQHLNASEQYHMLKLWALALSTRDFLGQLLLFSVHVTRIHIDLGVLALLLTQAPSPPPESGLQTLTPSPCTGVLGTWMTTSPPMRK